MRLISYRENDQPGVGVMVDDRSFVALPKAAPDLPTSLKALIERGDAGMKAARAASDGRAADLSFDQVTLDPVIPDPHAIWALALNFKTHIQETGLTTSDKYPQIFMRMPISQVGHLQPLWCPNPKVTKVYDYEGELAVIIGTPGRHIPVGKALDHVAGYSCYNEGSVREFQGHNRQFGLGKNFERSGSFGPWMMTPDEFGNPADSGLETRLNGNLRQTSPLSDMLFSVEDVIHYLSTGYTLQPGDVIVMGTCGALPPQPGEDLGPMEADHIPGRVHMKPGDTVTVEIKGLGILENPVIADPTPV